MRQTAQFPVQDLVLTKRRLLAWADTHSVCLYLDSNGYPVRTHGRWECLVAVGAADYFRTTAGQAFNGLRDFWDAKKDWLFGFLSYDLKNEVEKLRSDHPDRVGFPELFFFQPHIVAGIRRGGPEEEACFLELFSLSVSPALVYAAISNTPLPALLPPAPLAPLKSRFQRAEYLETVEAIRQHIIDGDVYELNLCQEFYANPTRIDPLPTFERLNALAQAPFSTYLRLEDRYLLCASPERFLCKKGATVVSQPIKGTRRRHPDPVEDAQIREQLRSSIKDRAENVMIVDLVRNDLARHCRPGTVQVDELFGVYSFRTVHQMISTVSGELKPETHPVEVLRDAFPMGSMTGAPKVMAMELIERYERSRRGLFSGAVGYFTPDADFDFNVVIRSILYHAGSGYLSCQVGGAIVYDSAPEQEYEECLVKAHALMQALGAAW